VSDLNDLPKTNAAEYARERARDSKSPDAPQLFASYLIEHGFGRLRIHNVLKPVWPEAASRVEITGEDAYRAIMLAWPGKADRKGIIALLDGGRQMLRLSDASFVDLLDEWDALNFPNQIPETDRERALKRHRFAIGESDSP
jgi:hypothetical protein